MSIDTLSCDAMGMPEFYKFAIQYPIMEVQLLCFSKHRAVFFPRISFGSCCDATESALTVQ